MSEKLFLSGDEAVAQAAFDAGVALGTGYPGTPSTEILEHLHALGGRAQWAPNEKVAVEVALGASYGGMRALVTMKHVGLNVAADPFFTAAYTGVSGALIVVSADDPGLASSQNEQDNRHYAEAAGVPMLEPADPQEAYDLFLDAIELSERWGLPVLFRMTTRVCHSKSVLTRGRALPPARPPFFERDPRARVMIPAYARPAHVRLRQKLAEIAVWSETSPLHLHLPGDPGLGIITSGVSFTHVREAAPEASVLKLGLTYPLPFGRVREFAAGVRRCVVVEEGDPYLVQALRAAGIPVEGKAERYRFGELTVDRVRRILAGDDTPETPPLPGKPPQLCPGCPHRRAFELLRDLDCIVAGDIGCYTLGVLPPFEAMDSCVCMGASIGVGLGLRHVLPDDQARRVVSVMGDSTFLHSGLTGLVEMAYNPPRTGHVVLVLDNGTTAMTGLQEHPGTGRDLGGTATGRISLEEAARALGAQHVHVVDPLRESEAFSRTLRESLALNELSVIISRRPCILSASRRHGAAAASGGPVQEGPAGEPQGPPRTPIRPVSARDLTAPGSPLPPAGEAPPEVVNVRLAGLGGQGVITAADLLAQAAFRAGYDVKQSELHGMSQRGGSVSSDVRFGARVASPMIPQGRVGILVVISADQIENTRPGLRPGGTLIEPGEIDPKLLPNPRTLNLALLGRLSTHLGIPEPAWTEAIQARFPPERAALNLEAFRLGRTGTRPAPSSQEARP